ncbi:hypothetical protein FQN60_015963 [Etheostoma spectabile]|uniref:G-protein coupled receptors family 1 profile domain-containing protein n=1 Tax=Etheostoma spectabile TaxID=54343 RepID=A0A5J5CNW6_9PERO|nr:hypothetical protein FQN60_015963 [Etheostoma spectabile]
MANTIGPILSFNLPVITMLCIYLKIFLVAQKQHAASRIQPVRANARVAVSKMERKATKTLGNCFRSLSSMLVSLLSLYHCFTFH